MSPYEAVLRSFGYIRALHRRRARCGREAAWNEPFNRRRATRTAWAMLSVIYSDEYGSTGSIAGPDSLGRALRAARTAVEAAPSIHLPLLRAGPDRCSSGGNSSLPESPRNGPSSLNPMDGDTAAYMGLLHCLRRRLGAWLSPCPSMGMQLNPNHPGWYCASAWLDALPRRRTTAARSSWRAQDSTCRRTITRTRCWPAAYGQLGEMEAARKARPGDCSALKPDFASVARGVREVVSARSGRAHRWTGSARRGWRSGREPERLTSAAGANPRAARGHRIGRRRAPDEGFWVAVLPFKYTGANADLTALAEGLSEEIVTGLSRFSYLRVIARSSTARDTRRERRTCGPSARSSARAT